MHDPRGPVRTATHVEARTDIVLVTLTCGHVGHFVPHFTYRVGDTHRCFRCGQDAAARRE